MTFTIAEYGRAGSRADRQRPDHARVDLALEGVAASRERRDGVVGRVDPGDHLAIEEDLAGRVLDLDVVRHAGVLVAEVDGERLIHGRLDGGLVVVDVLGRQLDVEW